jgi:outer membrane phospholipase A
MIFAIILSLLMAQNCQAASSDPANQAQLGAALNQILACRTSTESLNEASAIKAINCFESSFSNQLSIREKAGISHWFQSMKSIEHPQLCDAENKYQISSYHAYTPYYLCVDVKEPDGSQKKRIIFFQKEENKFRVSAIYFPPNR